MRNPFRHYVCDSRGQVHVVPQADWKLGVVRLNPREEQLALLRADLRGAPYAMTVRAGAALVLGVLIGAGLYREALRQLGQPDAVGAGIIAMLVGGVIAWGLFRLGARPVDLGSARARLLACRLCICCGYDLLGLTPAEDGCTVCPECSAAWDLRTAEEPGA